MKKTLKEARKECREYMKKYFLYSWPISFNKDIGFYFIDCDKPDRMYQYVCNKETVFMCYPDGRLEKIAETKESIKFHNELLKIRKKRQKENKL